MKSIGNSDGSASGKHLAAPDATDFASVSQRRRAHGRRLEIAEENELVGLLRAYSDSSLAQIRSLVATSAVIVQDVAYVRGLKGDRPDSTYAFAPFTETVVRHSSEAQPVDSSVVEAADSPVAEAADSLVAEAAGSAADSGDGSSASAGDYTNAQALTWAEALAQAEAEIGAGRDCGSGRKKDRAAGRRRRRIRKRAQELIDNPPPLPDFPGYDPRLTFFTWLRGNIDASEVGVYSSLLGATTSTSLKHLTSSMTLVHGLPRFLRRCLDGDFTIEHVAYVTRRCRDLRFEHFPAIDGFLAKRRADITIETFKRSLALKIAATQPPEDTQKNVALRRRVDISTGDDGTAYLTLTGPAPELQACYKRLEAFVRAVYKGNTSAFSDQLKTGDCFDDDRAISALMFDVLTRTRPQLKLRVISTDNGESTSTDFPLDGLFAGPDGVPMHDGESLLDYIERVFDDLDRNRYQAQTTPDSPPGTAGSAAEESGCAARDSKRMTPADRVFESQILEALLSSRTSTGDAASRDTNDALSSLIGSRASGARPAAAGADIPVAGATDAFGIRREGGCRISYELILDMPTNEYWLSNQARTFITVPMLTLLSHYLSEVDDESRMSVDTCESDGRPTNTGSPPVHSVKPPPEEPLTSKEVCDLAGMLPDGSPIPADMARRVAGYASTWTRLLTDPATGTPVDAKAMTYTIPNSIRKTLIAQYVTCTFPGCTLPADTAEVDHIDPFDLDDPSRGGLTRFGNLHCLCKQHHTAKTDGKFDVRMAEPGHLEYVFRRGVTVEVVAPDNPLNVEHARLFLERFGSALPRPNRPYEPAPEPTATEESPAPGDRKRARECPEPAASDGQPGWREATPGFGFGNQSTAHDESAAGGDSAGIRDWFWGSGEPPPF